MKKNYFKNYLDRYSEILIKSDINKLKKIANLINDIKIKKKKVIIIGNGGSASIASHVCVDLTKICKVRSVNFNEANLLTCFSNDYGYEKWVEKSIENKSNNETHYPALKQLINLFYNKWKSKNNLKVLDQYRLYLKSLLRSEFGR